MRLRRFWKRLSCTCCMQSSWFWGSREYYQGEDGKAGLHHWPLRGNHQGHSGLERSRAHDTHIHRRTGACQSHTYLATHVSHASSTQLATRSRPSVGRGGACDSGEAAPGDCECGESKVWFVRTCRLPARHSFLLCKCGHGCVSCLIPTPPKVLTRVEGHPTTSLLKSEMRPRYSTSMERTRHTSMKSTPYLPHQASTFV